MTAPAEEWHLVTGEYPPQRGGVADYTRGLARGLAAHAVRVHVWCPHGGDDAPADPGVLVHPIAGTWSRADLRRLDAALDAERAPRRLLVQWVPHAFGRRSLNVGFCAWIRSRGLKGDRVELVVHEAFHAFGEGSWKQDAAAAVHRFMVTLLLRVATRAWVTIPAWADRLRRYAWRRPVRFCWLPVPSNVPVDGDTAAVARIRAEFDDLPLILGHFGTYSQETCRELSAVLGAVLEDEPTVGVLLIGKHSDRFREQFLAGHGSVSRRVRATGSVEATHLSHALQACDVLAQPYIDGASTRRTTLMAGLAHGVPVVTTIGRLSDSTWADSKAVVAVEAGDSRALAQAAAALLHDHARRRQLAAEGLRLYAERFDLGNAVEMILSENCLAV